MLCCSEPLRACHHSFSQAHSCRAFIALCLELLRDYHCLCPRSIEAYHHLLFLCPLPDNAQPVFSQVSAGRCSVCVYVSGRYR